MKTLKSMAAGGVRWGALETAATTILKTAQIAILGRLLDPKAFGLMAMVMWVVGFATVFARMELPAAVIQRKNPSNRELSSLYWFSIVLGFLMCGILCLVTPLVAVVFHENEIKGLLPVAALVFVITPFGLQFQALLKKNLRFDVLARISIFSTSAGVCMAVGCAWKGWGVWSLLWGGLTNSIVRAGLLMIFGRPPGYRPRCRFKWSDTKGYLRFGGYRTGAMAANYISARMDQLIIGALLGPSALGYYSMARRLVFEPVGKINQILTGVAFPLFSVVQEDVVRLKSGFVQLLRFLTAVNGPLLTGLAVVAPVAVPLLVGAQWVPAVPVVQVLSLYALLCSLGNAGGNLLLATGKADWTFYWNAALLLVTPPIVYVSSLGGDILHVAVALTGVQILLTGCHFVLLVGKVIPLRFASYLQAWAIPLVLSFVMGGVVYLGAIPLSGGGITRFVVQAATGVGVYGILIWRFQRELLAEIIGLIPVPFRRGDGADDK